MKRTAEESRLTRRMLTGVFAAGFLVVAAALLQAADNETQESLKTAAAISGPIPLAEVATRATEVTNLLSTLQAQFGPSPTIAAIRKELPRLSEHIDLLLQATTEILREQPPLATLQTQQLIWEGIQTRSTGWLKTLTERAVRLRGALNRLAELQETWAKTVDAAKTSKAPETTVQQIDAVLAAIVSAQSPLEAERGMVLNLQSRVSREVARCESVLTQIAQAQKEAVGGILVQDSLPIWSAKLWAQARISLGAQLGSIAATCLDDLREYVRNPSCGMPIHVAILLLLIPVWYAARRRVDLWLAAGGHVPHAAEVFDHPYAAALIGVLIFATSPVSRTPQTVQELYRIAVLIPMVVLVRPVAGPGMVPGLCGVAILFAVDIVRQTLDGAPLIGRVLLELETLAGISMIGWSMAFGRLRPSQVSSMEARRIQLLRFGAAVVLFVLAVALIAGALGYLRLARLLTSEILGGAALALGFYGFLLVLNGMVVFALRTWPLRSLAMVHHHRDVLERRAQRVLIWLAISGWLFRWLDYVGLLQPTLSLGEGILAMNLERGAVNISLGDVLAFLLSVWVAYLLSALIRFTLKEEVYPRLEIAPGLSYAISSLLHYLILALGVVVGMGLMGIDLARVSILAGALGVGIGFGLQSVVNNFVCGLILLFERPIHVGDMVEVGDLLGEVRRIGIRASTVHTRGGADIILPNAQLVTDKVTNWTLSDKLRRIQLPVGVNYGASPRQVIEILETVARSVPRILQKPPPRALLMDYGDSSIDFELRAWTDEYLNWRQVRSDLAVAVYDAMREAGLSFPFPQREIRFLKDPENALTAEPEVPKPRVE